jgi:LPXTG-site transpeptidase (sortase) family protein
MHPSNPSNRRALRILERLLLIAGLLTAGWLAVWQWRAVSSQAKHASVLERALHVDTRGQAGVSWVPGNRESWVPGNGEMVGRLEIPRVGMSVMVVEGDDEDTLQLAAGHLPDTVWPWEVGNSAIAGHRDTFFRPLKDVRVNDAIRLVTLQGTFDYTVTDTQIVNAGDVSVLAPMERPVLTLVTCYPFTFVGSAPKRFIVHATRGSGFLESFGH